MESRMLRQGARPVRRGGDAQSTQVDVRSLPYYNSALEERRAHYQMRHTGIGYTRQAAELPDLKAAFPAYQEIHSQVLQDVLRRVDKTFAAFFRRVAKGETPGYPRFKSTSRYHSFTYPQSGFVWPGTSSRFPKLATSKFICIALCKAR